MKATYFATGSLALFLVGAGECPPGPDDTPTPCEDGQVLLEGECVPDLPPGWTQIVPGGDTICAKGGQFSYWVRKGTTNKLVVGFDGGGACWDAATCSDANPIFSDSVTAEDNPNLLRDGVFDMDNPENPFKDWFAIFIPYCTGDVHWGDNVVTYPPTGDYPEVTVRHKGFVNGTTVMNWVYNGFSDPDAIFVTGVSAGSYGSMMFAPYLMDHYPSARVTQFGDSGAGVITEEFLNEFFNSWNAQANFPSWIPEIADVPVETLTLNDIYVEVTNYYPNQILSQYNTAYDENQTFYYEAMGGDPADWPALMEANIQEISSRAPTFRYYTAWGELHGILPYPEFYTYQVNERRLRDWTADLVAGIPVENVHCTDCTTPEYYEP